MSFENPQNDKPSVSEEAKRKLDDAAAKLESVRESRKAEEDMVLANQEEVRKNPGLKGYWDNLTSDSENFIDKEYREETKINGVDVFIEWDEHYKDYVIVFPQIETTSDEAQENKVYDPLIRISEHKEKAKDVFNYVSELLKIDELTKKKSNVYKIFKKIEQSLE